MRRWWTIAALLLAWAALLLWAGRASFSTTEARLIWRSTLPTAPIDGTRARLDDELRRMRAILDDPRAQPFSPVLALNGLWVRTINSQSLTLRLPSAWAALLLLALSLALLRRRVRALALALIGLPALLQALALPPTWPDSALREAAQLAAALRQPDEPLLNALPPWHPLAIHAQQAALLAGPRLELAWQDVPHEEAALRRYAATTHLVTRRVWLLAEADSPAWRTLDSALRADGRFPVHRDAADGALIVAYGR